MSVDYLVSCWRGLPMSTSAFWLVVQSRLWPLSFFLPGVWYSTYFLSIFVYAAASLFFVWVASAVCHCWKYAWVVGLSLQACSNVTLKDVAVLGECYPPWFFESPCPGFCLWCCISVLGRCSFQRSPSECCWHIILVCRFLSPLSSTSSSSDPDFHFHQLIPVAFVVAHVVY